MTVVSSDSRQLFGEIPPTVGQYARADADGIYQPVSIAQLKSELGLPFASMTPPTSPFAGQVWDQTDANGFTVMTWIRSGDNVRWLSEELIYALGGTQATLSATNTTGVTFPHAENYDIWLEDFVIKGTIAAATSPGGAVNSTTSYWVSECRVQQGGGTASSPLSPVVNVTTQNRTYTSANNNLRLATTIGRIVTKTVDNNVSPRGIVAITTKTGTPPNIGSFSFVAKYRLIYN